MSGHRCMMGCTLYSPSYNDDHKGWLEIRYSRKWWIFTVCFWASIQSQPTCHCLVYEKAGTQTLKGWIFTEIHHTGFPSSLLYTASCFPITCMCSCPGLEVGCLAKAMDRTVSKISITQVSNWLQLQSRVQGQILWYWNMEHPPVRIPPLDRSQSILYLTAKQARLSSPQLINIHTSYLSLFLHNHNLRPENFTLESA